jgi:hypothetical protein
MTQSKARIPHPGDRLVGFAPSDVPCGRALPCTAVDAGAHHAPARLARAGSSATHVWYTPCTVCARAHRFVRAGRGGVSGHETAQLGQPECALTVRWDDERYQAALFTSPHPPTCVPSNGNLVLRPNPGESLMRRATHSISASRQLDVLPCAAPNLSSRTSQLDRPHARRSGRFPSGVTVQQWTPGRTTPPSGWFVPGNTRVVHTMHRLCSRASLRARPRASAGFGTSFA